MLNIEVCVEEVYKKALEEKDFVSCRNALAMALDVRAVDGRDSNTGGKKAIVASEELRTPLKKC